MTPDTQVVLSVSIPTIAVSVGILINNRQIDALRQEMREWRQDTHERFTSLEHLIDARFEAAHQALLRVERVMDARLKHLEERG